MSRHKFQQGSNVVQSLNGCGARRSQAGNGSFHVTKPWLTTENVSLTAEAGFYYYLSPTEQEILFTRSADAVPAYTIHPDGMPTANETATSAVSNITQEQLPGYASLKREPSSPSSGNRVYLILFRSRDAPTWRGIHTCFPQPSRVVFVAEARPGPNITRVELCAHTDYSSTAARSKQESTTSDRSDNALQ